MCFHLPVLLDELIDKHKYIGPLFLVVDVCIPAPFTKLICLGDDEFFVDVLDA